VCWGWLLLFLASGHGSVDGKQRVMPWMCLERCGFTSQQINEQLDQIHKIKEILSAVSFEKYNLGPNSTLVTNNLTDVCDTIQKDGLETWPMISSYPYPPNFMDWMRQLFANPQPFILTCVEQGLKYGYTGYNVDWEPTVDATPQDSVSYANFLSLFARELHLVGMKLSVDSASWSPLWNYTLLSQSKTDIVITMDTYAGAGSGWDNLLDTAVDEVGVDKLGVGLETVDPNTNAPLSLEDVAYRFQQIEKKGVKEIDIWSTPIPDSWIPFLSQFVFGLK